MALNAELRRTESQEGRGVNRYRLCFTATTDAPGAQDMETPVLDLSATGFLIESASRLPLDQHVQIQLPSLGRRSAILIWRSGNYHGGQFSEALSHDELRSLFAESDFIGPAFRTTSSEDRVGEVEELVEVQVAPLFTDETVISDVREEEPLPLQRKAQIIALAAAVHWVAIALAAYALF